MINFNSKNRAIYSTIETESESLYILWVDDILSTAIYFQKSGRTTYLSMVDSTGYNRGYSKLFIIYVLRMIKGFIMCFSYPKNEFIFGRSCKNRLKRILEPKELFELWEFCFKNRCIKNKCNSHSTWSNFSKNRKFPFTNFDQIDHFEDSPITRMKGNFKSLEDLFEGLLVRKDFMNGGLIFSDCNCQSDSSNESNLIFSSSNYKNSNTNITVSSDQKYDRNETNLIIPNLSWTIETDKIRLDKENKLNHQIPDSPDNKRFKIASIHSTNDSVNYSSTENIAISDGRESLEKSASDQSNPVQKVISFLRNSDFSTLEKARKASEILLSEMITLPFKGIVLEKVNTMEELTETIKITPRRKR